MKELSTIDALLAILTFEEKKQRSVACPTSEHVVDREAAAQASREGTQFGFRQGRSAADLYLLLSTEWSAVLERSNAAIVVALDMGEPSIKCGMLHSSLSPVLMV